MPVEWLQQLKLLVQKQMAAARALLWAVEGPGVSAAAIAWSRQQGV
jgi:hypothetical protein